MYNILEAHIEFKNGKLHKVTVLVNISPGDVRAIFLTDIFMDGYDMLNPDEPINEALLQRTAGYGRQTIARDKIFRGWKRKYFPGSKKKK